VQAAKQRAAATDREALASGVSAQIRQSVRHARMLTVVAPFAAAGGNYGTTSNTLLLLTRAVASFIKVAAGSLSMAHAPYARDQHAAVLSVCASHSCQTRVCT